MATYNWSTVLPYSIASVLDQTYSDFELLVVGDGCTDDSEDVVAQIPDSRVRWYNLASNTRHQSGPNNEGLRRARGDVIAYIGHDDLWLPHHLEVLLPAIDGGTNLAHATTLGVRPDKPPSLWPERHWAYQLGEWIPPTTVLHQRALVDSVGGWRMPRDTGFMDSEADLWQRMAAVGGRPRWVKRLTSVKLYAGIRRSVYRERPCHEQEYWLTRIRAADDPERSVTAATRDGTVVAPGHHLTGRQMVAAVRSAVRIRSRLHLRRPIPDLTAEERWRASRAFKGLDDPDGA